MSLSVNLTASGNDSVTDTETVGETIIDATDATGEAEASDESQYEETAQTLCPEAIFGKADVGGQSVLVHNRCTGIDAETTTHGKIRIGERGLTQREYDLLRSSKNIKTQADGAKVFIRAINSNKNNVLVINDTGEIITFIKEVTKHELKNLARNYGWR